jgi:hypothetical protein
VSESTRLHPHLRVTREGVVQTITLTNVERRNAQTPSMWVALAELAENLDPGVRSSSSMETGRHSPPGSTAPC